MKKPEDPIELAKGIIAEWAAFECDPDPIAEGDASDALKLARYLVAQPEAGSIAESLDFNRLLSGDRRALYEHHQHAFDAYYDALQDAERYRYLRAQMDTRIGGFWVAHGTLGVGVAHWFGPPLDEAIDEQLPQE